MIQAIAILLFALGLIIGHFFKNQSIYYRGYTEGYHDANNDRNAKESAKQTKN